MGEFYVTEQWLTAHSNKGAAWTSGQLRVLGVEWPPKRGWTRRVVGTSITKEQRAAFEQLASERQARDERRLHRGH